MSGIEIGRSRRKSSGGSRSGGAKKAMRKAGKVAKSSRKQALKSYKGALKNLKKLSPAEQVKATKALTKKLSPLNKVRVQKEIRRARKRELEIEQGEPFNVDMPAEPQAEQFVDDTEDTAEEQGIDEVNEPEFEGEAGESEPDSEEQGEGMNGLFGDEHTIFPAMMSGKSASIRRDKKRAKVEGKKAKADTKRAKGEAKKMKAQAKIDKANRPKTGKGSELLDKAIDTAKGFAKGGKEESAPEPTFFEKNKMLIIGGGAVVALGLFMAMRKK